MGAATYIGRVGGLAVALGVGTALIAGHGTALADDGSSTSASSSSDSSAASASESTASQSTPKDATPGDSTPAAADAKDSNPKDPKASAPDGKTAGPAVSGQVSAQTNTGSSSTKDASTKDTSAKDTEAEPDTKVPDAKVEPDPKPEAEVPVVEEPAQETPPVEPKKPTVSAPKNDSATDSPATAAPKAALKTEPLAAAKATAVKTAAAKTAAAKVETVASATAATEQADTEQAATPVAAAARTMTAEQPAAAAGQNPLDIVHNLVSSVVNWVLGPVAGTTPTAPAQAPIGWALLAFARREIDNFVATATGRAPGTPAVSAQTTSLALADPFATAAVTPVPPRPGTPVPGQQFSPSTSFVDWVTGNFQPNNTFQRYGIWGTDVGVMWDNGIADDPTTPINEHQVLIAFGDTFGGPNMTGTWRLNTLFRSSDLTLADGLSIPNGEWFNGNMFGGSPLWEPTYARQIILPERLPAGLPAGVTLIPTAGISVPTPGTEFGATQYLSFMSVKQWGSAGQWTTNYSAMAYSTDNGENWYIAPTSVRMNDPYSGNAKFQQAALVRPGDGYVYAYGTPNGRQGAAYVSRVLEQDILDVSKYEYYSKGTAGFFGFGATKAGWYRNPAAATAVFGQDKGACGVAKPGNQVSEMSVQYNKQLNKYVVMHADQFNNIVIRTSDTPQGTWSSAKVVMKQQPGGIYAPMMHPWSPSTLGTGTELYWNMSLWSEYNVMLMKTDLSKI